MTPMSNDPGAEARRRRKEIIQSQRSESQNETTSGSTSSISNVVLSSSISTSNESKIGTDQETNLAVSADGTDNKPPKKRKVAVDSYSSSLRKNSSNKEEKSPDGDIDHSDENNLKKSQIRYDPEVPMSKDQLAAWRREARRVRNRESAAASRQRIRSRITELEEEVGDWKAKYNHAIQRLDALEKCVVVNTSGQQQEQPTLAPAASQQQLAPPQQQPQQQQQQQQQQQETASGGTISSTTTGTTIDI